MVFYGQNYGTINELSHLERIVDISHYRWESKVRDYELDCQNIVNNATYVNYFEQCRNDYARAIGIDYVEYHNIGFNLVVASIEVQYRAPLGPQEEFYVTARLSGLTEKRIQFEQEIVGKNDERIIAKAIANIACVELKTGKSAIPTILREKLLNFLPNPSP